VTIVDKSSPDASFVAITSALLRHIIAYNQVDETSNQINKRFMEMRRFKRNLVVVQMKSYATKQQYAILCTYGDDGLHPHLNIKAQP